MLESLQGYRTYIIAILIVLIGVVKKLGYIDSDVFQLTVTTLLGGGLATLRAAVPGSSSNSSEE